VQANSTTLPRRTYVQKIAPKPETIFECQTNDITTGSCETKQSMKTHNKTKQTSTQGYNTLLTMTLRQQHNNNFMLKDSVRSIKLFSKQQWHSF